MKKFVSLLAASLLIGSAFAGVSNPKAAGEDAGRHWVINVGLFQPTGDHKDLGVDSGFTASFDFCFGNNGDGNSSWFAGIGGFFGDGDNDFTTRSVGLHVGVVLGLGKEGDDNPSAIELKGGYYSTRLKDDTDEDTEGGFGGMLSLVYRSKSSNGHGVRFAAGWYTLPEVRNVDNTGYFFTVGFPIGGK